MLNLRKDGIHTQLLLPDTVASQEYAAEPFVYTITNAVVVGTQQQCWFLPMQQDRAYYFSATFEQSCRA